MYEPSSPKWAEKSTLSRCISTIWKYWVTFYGHAISALYWSTEWRFTAELYQHYIEVLDDVLRPSCISTILKYWVTFYGLRASPHQADGEDRPDYMSRNVRKRTLGMRPAKIHFSLRIRAVWSESSLVTFWTAKDVKFLHADNKDSNQTVRIRRLIWVFVGRTSQKVRFLTLRFIPCSRYKSSQLQ